MPAGGSVQVQGHNMEEGATYHKNIQQCIETTKNTTTQHQPTTLSVTPLSARVQVLESSYTSVTTEGEKQGQRGKREVVSVQQYVGVAEVAEARES